MLEVQGENYPGGWGGPATTLNLVSVIMPFFALLLVGNRVYYRFKNSSHVGWDDATIMVALVSNAVVLCPQPV